MSMKEPLPPTNFLAPWRVVPRKNEACNLILDATGGLVAHVFYHNRDANSRLIAAAPELLSVCVLALTSPHAVDCPVNAGEVASRCRCWHRQMQRVVMSAQNADGD